MNSISDKSTFLIQSSDNQSSSDNIDLAVIYSPIQNHYISVATA